MVRFHVREIFVALLVIWSGNVTAVECGDSDRVYYYNGQPQLLVEIRASGLTYSPLGTWNLRYPSGTTTDAAGNVFTLGGNAYTVSVPAGTPSYFFGRSLTIFPTLQSEFGQSAAIHDGWSPCPCDCTTGENCTPEELDACPCNCNTPGTCDSEEACLAGCGECPPCTCQEPSQCLPFQLSALDCDCSCENPTDCTSSEFAALDCECSCDNEQACTPAELTALDCEPTECSCIAADGDYLYTRADGVEVYNLCTATQRDQCDQGNCGTCCPTGEVVYECDCSEPDDAILGFDEYYNLVRNICSEYERNECLRSECRCDLEDGQYIGATADGRVIINVCTEAEREECEASELDTDVPDARDTSTFEALINGLLPFDPRTFTANYTPADMRLDFGGPVGVVYFPIATTGNATMDLIRVTLRFVMLAFLLFQLGGAILRVFRQW